MRSALLITLTLAIALETPSIADDLVQARQHFDAGTKAYDLGHYIDAVKEYEAAYNAKPDPAILYNIGQAYRLAGDYPSAIRSYKSYLRRVPDAENRPEVERRIADLQKVIDARDAEKAKAAPPAVVPTPSEPPRVSTPTITPVPPVTVDRGRSKRIAGIVLGSVGVVGVGVGIGFGIMAKEAGDDLSRINQMMQ